MKVFLLVLLAVTLSVAVPTQLTYTVGTNYVYNVSGVVQNNGYDTNVEDFVPGYYSYMEAYMVMQPVKEDDTSYLFVMNLYGTVVSVSNTSGSGSASQPGGKSLGANMYFTQLKTGQIVQIQYYSDDPIYYVNVKLGAINAFQTSLVSGTQTVFESDPVGNHSALISAVANADGSLTLTKEFSQSDFSAFPDPTVNAQNMNIAAEAVTSVHPSGYITSSFLKQGAIMTSGVSASKSKRSVTNSTGFDINLSALGSLSVQFAPNTALASTVFATKVSDDLITTNMFNFAVAASTFAKTNAYTLTNPVEILISKSPVPLATLIKVANHYLVNGLDELIPILRSDRVVADATIRDRVFFVLTAVKDEDFLVKYGLSSRFCDVVVRATLAAAHFDKTHSLQQALLAVDKQNKCSFAKDVASSVLSGTHKVKDTDFPFNKSYTGNITLGGKTASVNFYANAFAGTNLNCNNPSFNFEASAEATASVSLFGVAQQVFDAKIVYGQENGAPLADAITLSVWGNVIYNKALPVVPCQQESYPLGHVTPGFSVSHTLWVSIIPIVFSASTALDLTATWGWAVCPAQLTADVDISGDGSITVAGSTYTDLLLLRAGFDLNGAFQTDIIPSVSVQGALCQVNFEVDVNNQPLTASLTSYYEWRHCKFLFFNCDWTHYNEQSWWNWAEAAKDYVLFKMTYQIA